MGEYEEYNIIPNDLLENVAYAFYKDFDGNLPTIEDNIWRAQNCDEKSTGIAIGDTSPIIITSEKYQHNKDGTIEAEYETEYTATGTPSGSYKVHFEPNGKSALPIEMIPTNGLPAMLTARMNAGSN